MSIFTEETLEKAVIELFEAERYPHVGLAMGIVCAEHIAGYETVMLDYEKMLRATYCLLQVASFGLTEAQARERGFTVKIGRFPF